MSGLNTRLFQKIREEAGLAYYTGMYSSIGLHEGFLAFYAGTKPDAAKRVAGMLEKERKALAKKGLLKKEFLIAKARILGQLAEQQLHQQNLIFSSVIAEFYGNGHREPWLLASIFSEIQIKDLNQIIKHYLTSPALVTVTAGPH